MAHIHVVSAHYGGSPPWKLEINHPSHRITTAYYDDINTPSRHLALHPRMKAKIPKMLEWQRVKADWYIWLDSSIKIKNNRIIDWILNTADGQPLCLFKHSYANSIAEEARRVRDNLAREVTYIKQRYAGEPITEQVIHYYGDPEFKDDKLFGMTMFAYTSEAGPLMKEWFHHNVVWSLQDQISFPYVLQKSGIGYSVFNCLITEQNPYFEWNWQLREQSLAAAEISQSEQAS